MEIDMRLNQDIINKIKIELIPLIHDTLGEDLEKIILYGSCARGDFSDDSDIDIALLTSCDRMTSKKYDDTIAKIATELAMKYLAIVNFVCLPKEEFEECKDWYPYFKNIDRDGELIYG